MLIYSYVKEQKKRNLDRNQEKNQVLEKTPLGYITILYKN